MGRRPRQPAQAYLPGTAPPPAKTSTAVYQGVCKQINALFPRGDEEAQKRKRLHQGTIAQARSIAASIDRVSGESGYQAAGMQLASMHERLADLLDRLEPRTQGADPILALFADDPDDSWQPPPADDLIGR